MSTEQKVIEIITDEMDLILEPALSERLRDDLEIDSVDLQGIAMRCEEEFEIELDAATVEAWVTVRDVVDAVTQRVAE